MATRYWSTRWLAALGLMLAPVAWAAHGDDENLADLGLENLLDLEVYTAARFPQPRSDAPSALTVITADQIALYGFRSLDEILRSIPGVHTSYDHVYRYIGVRGLRRPQDFNSPVLLLVDGQRLNDGIYDTAALGTDFPVEVSLIEQVEFVRGPGSAAYGSNALLGVVNVITRDPEQSKGLRLRLEAGDARTRRGAAQLGLGLGEDVALLMAASYYDREGDDLYVPAFDAPETNNGFTQDVDRDTQRRFLAKLNAGDWRFQLVHGERDKQVPLPIYGADFNDPRNVYRDSNSYASLSYESELDDNWLLQTRGYNSYYEFIGDLAYDGVLNTDRGVGQRWGLDTRLQYRGWRHHRLNGGIEWIEDHRQDQSNFDVSPYALNLDLRGQSRTRGLFLQDEWQLRQNLRLTSGLRYDRVRDMGISSPRVALTYQPTGGHHLKLLYGRAFRAPSAYERDYAAQGYIPNPDLKPERTTNVDLHWEAYLSASLKLQLSLQHFVIDRYIVEQEDPDSGLIQYINDEDVHSRSVDLDLEKYWANGFAARISLSQQQVRRHDHSEPIDAPGALFKLYLSTPLPASSARLALEVQGVGQRRTTAGETDTYAVANLTLSSLRLSQNIMLSGSLYNLLGTEYADPASTDLADTGTDRVTQRGREFRLRLDWNF